MGNAVRVLAAALFSVSVSAAALAATLTVTNALDSGPGSLRQAILDSNASVGEVDTIVFDIPGTGPFFNFLDLGSLIVTDRVVIDGRTQPGYAGLPLFQIRHGSFNGTGMIISFTASDPSGGSGVFGLSFADLTVGLQIGGNENAVRDCFFGTDTTGTSALGNGIGILIDNTETGGEGNSIIHNLISRNSEYGIRVVRSFGTLIGSNTIGTTLNGQESLGNQVGISSLETASDFIGNEGSVQSPNLVSGNTIGIELVSSLTPRVAGNFIGTDATGLSAIPNGTGITIATGSGMETLGAAIGASSAGDGNLLSGNNAAIVITGDVFGTSILGNAIGLDVNGGALGNAYGIAIDDAATTNTIIGGLDPGEANQVAFNGSGIWNFGTRTTVRGNSIHDNKGIGIDLNNDGVTPNDPGDADVGPNGLQNFPVISSVIYGASTEVAGLLNSTPSTTFDLDFYANPPCSNFPHDFLQGAIYLGSTEVATDASGNAPFDVSALPATPDGSRISVTATDPEGNTSEFSQRLPFSVDPKSGPADGGTSLAVIGTNFLTGATVSIGGQPATDINVTTYTSLTATAPALTPGSANDIVVTNTDATNGTLAKGYVADFVDVPPAQQFYSYVTTLVSNGITAGVGGGLYGVNDDTLRQQMAVFLLKAKHGLCYTPPPCTGVFTDVPCPSTFADWIEALSAEGITGGCGGANYCPQNPVRRDQMAVFLLKAEHGSGYVPPPCAGNFADVMCPSTFADWIERLAFENITGGCGGGNYCPNDPNTRGQMAVFLTKTFSLQ